MNTATHKRRTSKHEYDLYGDLGKIKEAIMDATREARGKAGEVFYDSLEQAKEKTTAAKDNVTEYVEEKPLKSLGIALAAGFLLGYFFHKK